jgi:uncharacterized membrane protein YqjE
MIGDARRSRNPAGHTGLINNVVALLAVLGDFFGSRAALFASESKTALVHVAILLACVIAVLVLVIFGYVFLVVALVVGIAHLAHISSVWTVLGAGIVHFIIAAVIGGIAVAKIKKPLFRSTMAELKKDREWLRALDQKNPKLT